MAAKENFLMEKADSVWKMLDELAENDPEGYKKFMGKMLKENKDWIKPPQPVFCVQTNKGQPSCNGYFFINICQWNQLPEQGTENDRISVVASEIRTNTDNDQHPYNSIDLCFHPTILLRHRVDTNSGRKLVAVTSIDFIENQNKLKLSKDFKIVEKITYKGDLNNLNTFILQPKKQQSTQENTCRQESVLDNLSNIGIQSEMNFDMNRVKHEPEKTRKAKLIQEVSTKTKSGLKKPTYKIEVLTDKGKTHMLIDIDLPDVTSSAELSLEVSEDDFLLSSPNNEDLCLELPKKANVDSITSTFNKISHKLTVHIPTLIN